MFNIQRIFKTVGQGAFYEENINFRISVNGRRRKKCSNSCRMYYCTHNKICKEDQGLNLINIVYDCGTVTKNGRNILEKEIDRMKYDKIDILYISHFDNDHINGLPMLIDKKDIKNVILPQISNEVRLLILYETLENCKNVDDEVVSIIENPKLYFSRRGINYIEVQPNNENEMDFFMNEEEEPDIKKVIAYGVKINGSDISNINEIKSGSVLEYGGINWGWIPFNIEFKDTRKLIAKEIKKLCIQYPECMYSTDGINSQYIIQKLADRQFKKLITDIYNKIPHKGKTKGINVNSLTLYSGEIYINSRRKYFMLNNSENMRKTGCLYCGDYDTNTTKYLDELKKSYSAVWDNIGTIQIPHHGSIHSFPVYDAESLVKGIPIAVISCDPKRGYPNAQVEAELKCVCKKLYKVTQHHASRHRQCIRL